MDTRTRQLLDLYTDYLLASFGQVTATGLATLLPQQVSHDQVTRFLASNQFTNADLWKVVKPHLRRIQSQEGVLVLDDTVEEKPYTDESELINWHFDHVTNRTVKGINLLSALYVTQEAFLPVDFALIHKTQLVTDPKTGKDKWQSETTKHEIARQMIDAFIRKQVPFRYVLADVFYACAETMLFIKHKKHKEFVFPLKNNRKVALSEADKRNGQWVPVSSLTLDSNAPSPVIYLESVPFALRVHRQVFHNQDGSEGVLYLVSSDLALSGSDRAALYQKRWKVEEYHKSLKSNACLAKSPTKTVRTQSNHFFASLVAFVKLEAYRLTTSLNHFALRGKLYQAALASAFEQLQAFKSTCSAAAITA